LEWVVKNIELLRHAESAANAGLSTSNHRDIPLTSAGRLAADAAAREYEGPSPELIVVSPFRRAQETSFPFRKRFACALVEEWQVQEFTYLSPARFGVTSVEERRPFAEAYWCTATPETNDGPGAESFRDFVTRIQAAMEKLQSVEQKSILVVSHEMVIKAAMWIVGGDPDLRSANAPQRFREFSETFSIPNLGRWRFPAR
jgi:broad specificity phosphatase PhoE